MAEWFVGRKANFNLTWHETYRRLLRTIDGRDPPAPVRVIRRSKPIYEAARRGARPRRQSAGTEAGHSEWADKDYYIYLGVTAQSGTAALELATEIFHEAERSRQVGFGDIFPPQEMDEKLSGFLIPAEYATDGRIPAAPPREEEDLVGAFAFYDLPLPPTGHATPSLPFDRLLAWLSAAGEGRWESFVRGAKLLGAAGDVPAARSLFRRMVLLGHLDSRPDGAAWSIAPPVLVRQAADPDAAFWCGSRVDSLLAELPPGWRTPDRRNQPDGVGPSRWLFRTAGGGGLAAAPAGDPSWRRPAWGGAVAERLAALLPDLADWQETLGAVTGLAAPDGVEQWDVRSGGFREQPAFRVGAEGRCVGPAGLYRLTYGEGPAAYALTAYFDPGAPPARQVLRGEWYGLRFLAMSRANKYLKSMWRDHEGGMLSVPQRQRWPLLYERALVLASGTLPWRDPETNLLHYTGIPESLAASIADHLGVQVEKAPEPVVA